MPVNALIDQKRVGIAVQQAGAGLLLRKRARVRRIREAVNVVLRDRTYREAAARIGEQIRQKDGAAVAADVISEFARTSLSR
jgi:UDP:flavonoid glycosyltransferase YjiC (YdhE family)